MVPPAAVRSGPLGEVHTPGREDWPPPIRVGESQKHVTITVTQRSERPAHCLFLALACTIEDLENLEVNINDDQLMGFHIRAEDLRCFYFRLLKKGGSGPAIVARGSGQYTGFSVSANLATGKLEVRCKPSQGVVPSEQAYALTKVLKRKFGAVGN